LGSPKAKTPQDALWSWLFGVSNSKTIEQCQKTRLPYDKTTQNPAGFKTLFSRPDATPDNLNYIPMSTCVNKYF